MKIILTTNQLTMGGAEHMVVRLANELSQRHDVTVVSEGGPLAGALPPQVPHLWADMRTKSPGALIAAALRLRRIVEENGIEIVHANSPNTAIAARLACTGLPIPVIASAHGVWEDWKKSWIARGFSLGAHLTVGCSRQLTDDLIRHGLPASRATTVHNGIPFDAEAPPNATLRREVRESLGLSPTTPLILGVGRLTAQKAFETLLQAIAHLGPYAPDLHVAIAGDGDRKTALTALAAELGIAPKVSFLGNRRDVGRLLAAADVFCLPSRDEGLPLAIAEAMASGLPVVATPVGGVPEIVVHEHTGLLVPPDAPTALADALARMLANPAERQRFGQAGRDRVATHFTLAHMARQFEALYASEMARLGAVRYA